jgi:hypothetical protein
MQSPEWRAKATASLASAIDKFFASRTDGGRAASDDQTSALAH